MRPVTLPLETFWSWLVTHPNCIVRAGTDDAALFDDDDLHWHFAQEADGAMLVQVIRGKRLLGELVVRPERVGFCQGFPGEHDDEYVFELVSADESERRAVYFFVLSHGYDETENPTPARVH